MKIDIEQTLGFSLHHASYLFKTALKNHFVNNGVALTTEEFVFLFLVPEGGAEQKVLIDKTKKDKTTITRLISKMVLKGYIERRESSDRRHQTIYPTALGNSIKEQLAPLVQDFVSTAANGITQDEIEITRRTLNKLSHNICQKY